VRENILADNLLCIARAVGVEVVVVVVVVIVVVVIAVVRMSHQMRR